MTDEYLIRLRIQYLREIGRAAKLGHEAEKEARGGWAIAQWSARRAGTAGLNALALKSALNAAGAEVDVDAPVEPWSMAPAGPPSAVRLWRDGEETDA